MLSKEQSGKGVSAKCERENEEALFAVIMTDLLQHAQRKARFFGCEPGIDQSAGKGLSEARDKHV